MHLIAVILVSSIGICHSAEPMKSLSRKIGSFSLGSPKSAYDTGDERLEDRRCWAHRVDMSGNYAELRCSLSPSTNRILEIYAQYGYLHGIQFQDLVLAESKKLGRPPVKSGKIADCKGGADKSNDIVICAVWEDDKTKVVVREVHAPFNTVYFSKTLIDKALYAAKGPESAAAAAAAARAEEKQRQDQIKKLERGD